MEPEDLHLMCSTTELQLQSPAAPSFGLSQEREELANDAQPATSLSPQGSPLTLKGLLHPFTLYMLFNARSLYKAAF